MDLDNVVAIVTGAASGLGAATSASLADRGASVFGYDLPGAIESAPVVDGVTHLAVDITDPGQVQAAVDVAAAGAGPLRCVVNCAGIGPSVRILGRKGAHDLAFYAQVVQVNLIGSFNVLTLTAEEIAATEPLKHGQRGSIVNTASIAAYEGQIGPGGARLVQGRHRRSHVACRPRPGAAPHPAQHHRSRHRGDPDAGDRLGELPRGARGRDPFPQRLGRPGVFADLALFLLGHDYLNGETIRLDGALRMAPR